MAGINWARLYESGRCKAIGIPWSDEESHAFGILKIPAEFVRMGCLTVEAYESALAKQDRDTEKDQKVPLLSLRKNQLMALCAKFGIVSTEDALRPSLIEQLLYKGIPKRILVSDVPEPEEDA